MTFELVLPRHVVFGRGAFDRELGRIAAAGSRLLIVHGASATPLAEKVREASASDPRHLLARGEPDLAVLRDALSRHRDASPDAVVAIGGGSVIDLGKALAALLPSPHDPLHHLEVVGDGAPLERDPLPFVAVPTTSGTGAEVTKNAVIGVPEQGRKVSLRDPRMLPVLALVDPALTEGAPRAVKLASGLDAVTQVIEPFLSRNATPFTDALCADAIPRGLRAIRDIVDAPDPEAHDDMAYVSLIGGIALANAGLGAVHGLAGVLGGRTGAAHGALCGRLLVPVLSQVLPELGSGKAAAVLGWIEGVFPGPDPLAALERWIDAAGLPRLEPAAVDPDVAEASRTSSSMRYSPVPADKLDLMAMLRQAS